MGGVLGGLLWPEVGVYHVLTVISELDAAWKTPSSLSSPPQGKAFCSLPNLIYRVSLGLEAWLISDVAFDTVSCKSFPTAVHVAIRHCARSFTIKQCCHIWHRQHTSSFMRETCRLMQISWCPNYCLCPLYISPSGMKLNYNMKPVSQKAFCHTHRTDKALLAISDSSALKVCWPTEGRKGTTVNLWGWEQVRSSMCSRYWEKQLKFGDILGVR